MALCQPHEIQLNQREALPLYILAWQEKIDALSETVDASEERPAALKVA